MQDGGTALAAGLLLAMAARAGRRRGQEPPLRYVALGDSLTVGVGSIPGYPARVAAGLSREIGRRVHCTNLGRIQMTSVDLQRALRQDPIFRTAVSGADLLTLCIGGNDLLRCGTDEVCLGRSVRAFGRRWDAVCQEVRSLNPEAPLVALTLYSPYPLDHRRGEQSGRWVERMNQVIANPGRLATYGMELVDITQVLHGQQHDLTWVDLGDIHPTGYGQRRIAAAVVRALAGLLRSGPAGVGGQVGANAPVDAGSSVAADQPAAVEGPPADENSSVDENSRAAESPPVADSPVATGGPVGSGADAPLGAGPGEPSPEG